MHDSTEAPHDSKTAIPWEDPRQASAFDRLVETIKLLATSPSEAFARMPAAGGIGQPLFFAIVVGWIGIAISAIWSLLFGSIAIPFLDSDQLGAVGALLGMSTAMTIMMVVLAPFFVLLAVFIQAAILHLMLLLVGGPNNGFEATTRVCSYAQVSQLAQAVPFCGGLLSLGWSLILLITGLAAVHNTSRGKAAVAVVLPVVICCGLTAALLFMGVLAGVASSR